MSIKIYLQVGTKYCAIALFRICSYCRLSLVSKWCSPKQIQNAGYSMLPASHFWSHELHTDHTYLLREFHRPVIIRKLAIVWVPHVAQITSARLIGDHCITKVAQKVYVGAQLLAVKSLHKTWLSQLVLKLSHEHFMKAHNIFWSQILLFKIIDDWDLNFETWSEPLLMIGCSISHW